MPQTEMAERIDGMMSLIDSVQDDLQLGGDTLSMYARSLDWVYENNSLAATIVDAVADDATSKGWSIRLQDTEQTDILDEPLEDLNVRQRIRQAHSQARLYGGAALILVVDDGLDLTEPLDLARVRRLVDLRVVTREELTPQVWDTDWLSPRCGEPSMYALTMSDGGAGAGLYVHASRVLPLYGHRLSRERERRLNGWGLPVLARVLAHLARFDSALDAMGKIVDKFQYLVLKLEGLATQVSTPGGEDRLRARVRTIAHARRVAGAMIIDAGDSAQDQSASVSGLPEMWDRFASVLAASAGPMPQTRLFGQAPGGLSTDDSAGARWWYDHVRVTQTDVYRPIIDRIVEVYCASREGVTRGQIPGSWSVQFEPLEVETPSQTANVRLANAQADAVYLDRGVVSPSRVARDRFGGDAYGDDLALTDEEIDQIEADMEAGAIAPPVAPPSPQTRYREQAPG